MPPSRRALPSGRGAGFGRGACPAHLHSRRPLRYQSATSMNWRNALHLVNCFFLSRCHWQAFSSMRWAQGGQTSHSIFTHTVTIPTSWWWKWRWCDRWPPRIPSPSILSALLRLKVMTSISSPAQIMEEEGECEISLMWLMVQFFLLFWFVVLEQISFTIKANKLFL